MYNTVKSNEDHWCLQRYLWSTDLNPNQPPQEKIIKTLIYGVKSSGNQAELALRKTADHSKDQYLRVNEVVFDVYVDDCISGEDSLQEAMETADSLEIVVKKSGFRLKGFTFSGSDPPEALSQDGKSISVGGTFWYPKIDKLSLDHHYLRNEFCSKAKGKETDRIIRYYSISTHKTLF
ncbi:uncharacterized protein [Clytia hemisphaerica]|uniref:uncharacterized protein n=1 Tax=Clytia hemisphaerica TaxID=252671 RepID=UPI0034D5868D